MSSSASRTSSPPLSPRSFSPSSTGMRQRIRRRGVAGWSSALAVVGALQLAMHCLPQALAAQFEPPGNQVLFGAWLDTQAGYNDTPAKFNQRLGYNVPVFQVAQLIPLPKYNYTTGAGGPAPESLIELSGTDAAVFLTVYPSAGFASVASSDFTNLANQILAYQAVYNRTVFLRYAPEMQGTWNLYGGQPTAFNTSWHAMYTIVKSIAPATIVVWAPNTPQGYPYGESFTSLASSAADIALLDTNRNGQLDAGDNGLDPYYPGDDVVDWIGISLYYKGTADSDVTNVVQSAGYCGLAINGINPATGGAISNWYTTYCANKPTKACMFAESGAAWHINDAGTATQLAIQQQWISGCIANATFFDSFPRVKLVMQFEFEKTETSNANTQDLRDYRVTNNTAVLAAFQGAIAAPAMANRFSWAQPRVTPTSISSPGAPAPTTNSQGSTIPNAITQTTRPRPTDFPSLFGTTSNAHLRMEIIQSSVMVLSGVVGVWSVVKWL